MLGLFLSPEEVVPACAGVGEAAVAAVRVILIPPRHHNRAANIVFLLPRD